MVLTETGSPQAADGNKQERASPDSLLQPWRLPLVPPISRAEHRAAVLAKWTCGCRILVLVKHRSSDLTTDPDVFRCSGWCHLQSSSPPPLGGCELLEIRDVPISLCVFFRAWCPSQVELTLVGMCHGEMSCVEGA